MSDLEWIDDEDFTYRPSRIVRLIAKVLRVEPETVEQWRFLQHKAFCFRCFKITEFFCCQNCGEWYCLRHCDWDNDRSWEMPSEPDYPICPYCCLFQNNKRSWSVHQRWPFISTRKQF